MAVEKKTEQPIGWFVFTPLDASEHIEIGYRLHQDFWGLGYATEMSRVLIEYGFDALKLDQIVGITLEENVASQNVLKKIGLRYVRNDRFYEKDVMFFQIDAA